MSTTYNALAAAIAQEENSTWPNNPGALEDTLGNPLQFPSTQDGYNALLDKLNYDTSGQSKVYSPNMSLSDFETTYTGGDQNAGNNVASILGVPSTTPIGQLSDQSLGGAGTFLNNALTFAKQALSNMGGTPAPYNTPNTPYDPTANETAASNTGSIFANVAAVLVGLVLIAGAVFSFSQVKDTLVSVAKKGAAVAA